MLDERHVLICSAAGAADGMPWWVIACAIAVAAVSAIGVAMVLSGRLGDGLLHLAMRWGPRLRGIERTRRGGWPCLVAARRASSTDAPPLIVLHGLGVRKETMLPLLEGLRGSRDVLAPDLPGFGEHDLEPKLARVLRADRDDGGDHDERAPLRFADVIARTPGPEVDAYVAAIEAWIGRAVDGPFDLAGASMGGALATAVAARRPAGLRRLVLLGPAGVRAPRTNEFMEEVARDVNPLAIETIADFDRVIDLNFTTPPRIPTFVKRALARDLKRRQPVQDLVTDALGPLLLDGIRDRLASVVAPTLVLWGGADEILDPSAAPIFEEGLPDAVVEIVDGAGHTLHGDRPREVMARIERFLDDAE